VFARSLTDLVKALQKKNTELRLTNRLFEESSQGMVITDAEQHILRVNPAFSTITKFAPEEVIGKTPGILKSGQHDATFYEELWGEINNKGLWQGEIYNKNKQGIIYPEWLQIYALKDEHGKLTHYIGIFDDISERKRSKEELRLQSFPFPIAYATDRVTSQISDRDRLDAVFRAFLAITRFLALVTISNYLRNDQADTQADDQIKKVLSGLFLL